MKLISKALRYGPW